MGSIISAEIYKYNMSQDVENFQNRRIISMENEQMNAALKFMDSANSTCTKCKDVFEKYKDYDFNKNEESTPLPNNVYLIFNKNNVLNEIHDDLQQMIIESQENKITEGFVHNGRISLIGRELRVLQETFKEIEPVKEDIEKYKICQMSINNTTNNLKDFCALLPEPHRKHITTVWLFKDKYT